MENMFCMKCHAQWIRKTIRADPEVLQYGRKKDHISGVSLCCRLLQGDGIDIVITVEKGYIASKIEE